MTQHRVALFAALHPVEDPERSADPRIRELVGALRGLPAGPAPAPGFRDELRAQLVAITPRLVAAGEDGPARALGVNGTGIAKAGIAAPAKNAVPDETAVPITTPATTPTRHGGWPLSPARLILLRTRLRAITQRLRLLRPLRLATATLTVLALLAGATVWMSRSALPGDTLYGVKRASEDAALSLTGSEQSRGRQLLSFAKTRIDEVGELLGQSTAMALAGGPVAGAAINPRTAQFIVDTLDAADANIRDAAQLLGDDTVRTSSSTSVQIMLDWAPEQQQRLRTLRDRIPAGDLHNRVGASAQLVAAAAARAQALRGQTGCSCLSRAAADDLGPQPCTQCATRQSPAPKAPAVPGANTATTPGPSPRTAPVPSPPARATGSAQPGAATGSAASPVPDEGVPSPPTAAPGSSTAPSVSPPAAPAGSSTPPTTVPPGVPSGTPGSANGCGPNPGQGQPGTEPGPCGAAGAP